MTTKRPSSKKSSRAARPAAAPKRSAAATTPKKRASAGAAAPPKKRKAAPSKPRPASAHHGSEEATRHDELLMTQIRELETELDRLIDEASRHDLEVGAEDSLPPGADDEPVEDLERTQVYPPALKWAAEPVVDADPEGLALTREVRAEAPGDLGFDPAYEERVRTVLELLYARYFRVQTVGIERVPRQGRCLLVANRAGALPLEGVMIKTAVKLEHPAARDVRWLAEESFLQLPVVGSRMSRLGAVPASETCAALLLADEQLCALFPEDSRGLRELLRDPSRIGTLSDPFARLALQTDTPIVPVAVSTSRRLGPLSALPAPAKWRIEFGEPIQPRSAAGDAFELAERIRATLQAMLPGR